MCKDPADRRRQDSSQKGGHFSRTTSRARIHPAVSGTVHNNSCKIPSVVLLYAAGVMIANRTSVFQQLYDSGFLACEALTCDQSVVYR